MSKTNGHTPRILVTDGEKDVRGMLALVLRDAGLEPVEAENGATALNLLRQHSADAMLLDLMMPHLGGLEVLRQVRKLDADLPVILVTGNGSVESVIEAAKYGVQGYLTKPLQNRQVVLSLRLALENHRCQRSVLGSTAPESGFSLPEFTGQSEQIRRVLNSVTVVAPTEFTAIIAGETGVGKELVARAIHSRSRRAAGPFVPVDCGSIAPTLIESELFGHEKGAFTGADRARSGSFEAAAGGTLFLDEIGNLPLAMQVKLLRPLQERQIYRVGGTTPLRIDVRMLAATNEDLPAMVEAGTFRRDLYYRLNEFDITVPPLRERGEDILLLARAFLDRACADLHKDPLEISPESQKKLLAYAWPGNIRQLRNVLRRAALLANEPIEPHYLGLAGASSRPAKSAHPSGPEWGGSISFKDIVRQRVRDAEREILLQALEQTHGNMAKAARALQIDYKTIRTKAKQYHITQSD